MDGAIRRFPFLADAEAIRLVCHPDAMTPDANPLLGPMPGVRGFWVAAGLSLNGFGGGGGIGRAIAGWITAGDPGVDIGPYRAWRFADTYRDPGFAAGLARETYSDYYRLRFPYDADVAGRPRRLSPLNGRLLEAGAVFGTKAGWERADHPSSRARRGAVPGATRPPRLGTAAWFERVRPRRPGGPRAGRDHRPELVREDRRSRDPARSRCSSGSCANDVDRPVGEPDLHASSATLEAGSWRTSRSTRLDAPLPHRDGRWLPRVGLGWLRANAADDDGSGRRVRDASDGLTVIGLWGPRARGTCSPRRPRMRRAMRPSRCARRGRSGSGGAGPGDAHELRGRARLGADHRCRSRPSAVWDALRRRPGDGLEPFGYRALDSLRLEKGYRYYGAELTHARHARRGRTRCLRPPRQGRLHRPGALVAARAAAPEGPARRLRTVSSATTNVCRSTAARRSATRAPSSGGSAASPTARPSERTIGYTYLPAAIAEGTASRSTSSTAGRAVVVRPTSSSTRPGSDARLASLLARRVGRVVDRRNTGRLGTV